MKYENEHEINTDASAAGAAAFVFTIVFTVVATMAAAEAATAAPAAEASALISCSFSDPPNSFFILNFQKANMSKYLQKIKA